MKMLNLSGMVGGKSFRWDGYHLHRWPWPTVDYVENHQTQHTSTKDIAGQSVNLKILINNEQGKERSLTITGSRFTLAPTRWVPSTMSGRIVKSLVGRAD